VDASNGKLDWWTQMIVSKNYEHKLCFENRNIFEMA
jgi:hypothetical protein